MQIDYHLICMLSGPPHCSNRVPLDWSLCLLSICLSALCWLGQLLFKLRWILCTAQTKTVSFLCSLQRLMHITSWITVYPWYIEAVWVYSSTRRVFAWRGHATNMQYWLSRKGCGVLIHALCLADLCWNVMRRLHTKVSCHAKWSHICSNCETQHSDTHSWWEGMANQKLYLG